MGGRWSLVQIQSPRPFHPLGRTPLMIATAAYRMAEFLVRRLPRRLITRLAVSTARFAFALRVPARRALETNLAALAPGVAASRGVARECFEHFARAFVEFT